MHVASVSLHNPLNCDMDNRILKVSTSVHDPLMHVYTHVFCLPSFIPYDRVTAFFFFFFGWGGEAFMKS